MSCAAVPSNLIADKLRAALQPLYELRQREDWVPTADLYQCSEDHLQHFLRKHSRLFQEREAKAAEAKRKAAMATAKKTRSSLLAPSTTTSAVKSGRGAGVTAQRVNRKTIAVDKKGEVGKAVPHPIQKNPFQRVHTATVGGVRAAESTDSAVFVRQYTTGTPGSSFSSTHHNYPPSPVKRPYQSQQTTHTYTQEQTVHYQANTTNTSTTNTGNANNTESNPLGTISAAGSRAHSPHHPHIPPGEDWNVDEKMAEIEAIKRSNSAALNRTVTNKGEYIRLRSAECLKSKSRETSVGGSIERRALAAATPRTRKRIVASRNKGLTPRQRLQQVQAAIQKSELRRQLNQIAVEYSSGTTEDGEEEEEEQEEQGKDDSSEL